MPAFDDCILWRLEGYQGDVVCFVVIGDEGLALSIEHDGEIVLAEMVANLEAGRNLGSDLRLALISAGFRDAANNDISPD